MIEKLRTDRIIKQSQLVKTKKPKTLDVRSNFYRHVADEHRMSGNCAQWQIVVRSRGVHVALYGNRWFAGLEIRKIGMLGYIALVQSMSRHVADSVRLLPSQLGVAIFRIVGMANEIADDARMTLGQIHVADGLDLRWRTA